MTDRHCGYVVTLEHDVREDDAQQIVTALSMTKGVLSVEPIVSDMTLSIAEERARYQITMKVYDALKRTDS